MSAYICDDTHHVYLAVAAIRLGWDGDRRRLANAFLGASIRSYLHQYPDERERWEGNPSLWELPEHVLDSQWDSLNEWDMDSHTEAQIVKSIRCWRYQSCEHPKHMEEKAWEITTWMLDELSVSQTDDEKSVWGAPPPDTVSPKLPPELKDESAKPEPLAFGPMCYRELSQVFGSENVHFADMDVRGKPTTVLVSLSMNGLSPEDCSRLLNEVVHRWNAYHRLMETLAFCVTHPTGAVCWKKEEYMKRRILSISNTAEVVINEMRGGRS